MNTVQIRLSFAGPVLANVEISVSDQNGYVALINVEHPIISLIRYITNAPNELTKPKTKLLQNDNVISNVEEVKIEAEHKELDVVEIKSERAIEILNNILQVPDFIEVVEEGLRTEIPELCEEGVNGTYFLKDSKGQIRGVFKPQDEEIFSASNPKAGEDRDDKAELVKGILPGEASLREVAAYLLDRDGFFGVPRTVLAKLNHSTFQNPKIGSLQEFIENDGESWDIGPSVFPINEVHKIGILDLLLMNLDRHGGNILYRESEDGSMKLIPIDQGFALPDTFDIPNLWFEWMNWSQSKKPFNADTLRYIASIDIDANVELLRKELKIREECLRVMKISSTLLKKGAASGLSLFALGSLICPKEPGCRSELDEMVSRVMEKMELESLGSITVGSEQEQSFFNAVFAEMDTLIASKVNQ